MPLCEITPLLSRERSLFCCCMLHDLMPFVDAHAAEASLVLNRVTAVKATYAPNVVVSSRRSLQASDSLRRHSKHKSESSGSSRSHRSRARRTQHITFAPSSASRAASASQRAIRRTTRACSRPVCHS
jgi:hypothetical protein